MADAWDQFPDAPAGADPWAQFPDAGQPNAAPATEVAPPTLLSRFLKNHPDMDPAKNNTWGQAAKNVAQSAAHLATGITGGLAGDVAGLGALMYDITANAVTDPLGGGDPGGFADPTAVRERVANALTYRPQVENSLTNRALTAPGRVVADASAQLQKAGDATGLPYVGSIAGGIPLAVASRLGVKAGQGARFDARPYGGPANTAVPERVPGTPVYTPEPTPQQAAIKSATDAGIKLNPMQAGSGAGRPVAAAAGRAQLDRELSMKNAKVVDDMAKKHIGLDTKRPLNEATINELRNKANTAYKEIAETGVRKTSDAYRADIDNIADRTGSGSFAADTPEAVSKLKDIYANVKAFDAKDAVAKIRQLRKDATKNIKSDDPERNALGYAQRQVADALDEEMARHVTEIGLPDLASRYKAARVQLAKLHSVEDAIEGSNVSARLLSKQKAAGVPLSGELKVIADAYDSFDTVLQSASKIRDHGPLSALDYLLGVGGAAVDPTVAAAVLARPAARAFLGSDLYQRLAIQAKGKAPVARQPSRPPNKAVPAAATAPSQERRAR